MRETKTEGSFLRTFFQSIQENPSNGAMSVLPADSLQSANGAATAASAPAAAPKSSAPDSRYDAPAGTALANHEVSARAAPADEPLPKKAKIKKLGGTRAQYD